MATPKEEKNTIQTEVLFKDVIAENLCSKKDMCIAAWNESIYCVLDKNESKEAPGYIYHHSL